MRPDAARSLPQRAWVGPTWRPLQRTRCGELRERRRSLRRCSRAWSRAPPPPPPPAPEVIEIVEDEEEIEETIIESTESDEELEIEEIEIEEIEEDVEVPFAVIENVPIFPGCERGSNDKKRKCMSEKIAKFVQRKFNTDLAGDLGLTGRQRISVIFKINKTGDVTGVRARAPHPRLEKEAQRVINLLPKMQPGKQRGVAVTVPYSLPIIFQVQD